MRGVTRARPGIHHDAWDDCHQIKARQKIAPHLGVQNRGGIVGLCGTVEGAPYALGVERVGRGAVPRRVIRSGFSPRGLICPGFVRRVHALAALLSACDSKPVGVPAAAG